MQGFLQRRVPTVVRRSLSLLPGVAIVCLGADPTSALLLSQVVLSLGVPFALVPLLHLGRQAVPTKPGTACTLAAGAVASAICGLNVALVWGTF
jgi:manganese transport protein